MTWLGAMLNTDNQQRCHKKKMVYQQQQILWMPAARASLSPGARVPSGQSQARDVWKNSGREWSEQLEGKCAGCHGHCTKDKASRERFLRYIHQESHGTNASEFENVLGTRVPVVVEQHLPKAKMQQR